MEINELKILNALNKINGLGSQKMRMLLDFFGSAENIWKSGVNDLVESKIGEALAQKIVSQRTEINPEEEWKKLEKENIQLATLEDPAYPTLLKEIPNPPYILYIQGSLIFNDQPMLAVVGSRKFTSYGKQAAFHFCQELTRSGILVVSGLALGIDAIAHQSTLEAGGKTIAVLGNSLELGNIAPRSNFELSRKIIDSGALVSELPLGTSAAPGMFPARNRLMAGMTLGTLVIEAAENSGSLITAKLALEFNREVFAVPGPIFSLTSEGVNNLIREGAKIVTSVKDVLEELNIEKVEAAKRVKKIMPATAEEEKILKILSPEPLHIDKIIELTKLRTAEASSTLSIMEMKGMIKNIGGQNYITL